MDKGTFISDFKPPCCTEPETAFESVSAPRDETGTVKRLYAVQRGRKAVERDEKDLLAAFKAGTLRDMLLSLDMVEEVVLC